MEGKHVAFDWGRNSLIYGIGSADVLKGASFFCEIFTESVWLPILEAWHVHTMLSISERQVKVTHETYKTYETYETHETHATRETHESNETSTT